jgi:hypothetical protein
MVDCEDCADGTIALKAGDEQAIDPGEEGNQAISADGHFSYAAFQEG